MTTYAYDPDQAAVVATWPVAVGNVATTVVELPATVNQSDAFDLVYAMTDLSRALWLLYVEPRSVEIDAEQEGSHREAEEEAARKLEVFLRSLNLPMDGMIIESYVAIEELGHRVGRQLHEIGDTKITDAIVAELLKEADAVTRADHGDLTGRAAQAVAIGRTEANPLQVETAFRLLHDEPFGSRSLFEEVEPSAACIAGAHWLTAAAVVTTSHPPNESHDPSDVFDIADDIEAVDVDIPSRVVAGILEEELSAREAVQELFDFGSTPRELLVELIGGINSTVLVFAESVDIDDDGIPRFSDEALPHPNGEQWKKPEGEDDYEDLDWDLIHEATRAKFAELIRQQAEQRQRPS